MDVYDLSYSTISTADGNIVLLVGYWIESVVGLDIGTNICNDLGLWDG